MTDPASGLLDREKKTRRENLAVHSPPFHAAVTEEQNKTTLPPRVDAQELQARSDFSLNLVVYSCRYEFAFGDTCNYRHLCALLVCVCV